MDGQAESERRAAENQALFREANERIEALNEAFDTFGPHGSWACECARMACLERIEMTLAEYEEVRADPTRFAVAPGEEHVFFDVERVVAKNERFWIVEKVRAAAARATELDPRSPERRQR